MPQWWLIQGGRFAWRTILWTIILWYGTLAPAGAASWESIKPPPGFPQGKWVSTATNHFVVYCTSTDQTWLDSLVGNLDGIYDLNQALMGGEGPSPVNLYICPPEHPLEILPGLFQPWDPFEAGFLASYSRKSPPAIFINASHFRKHPQRFLQQVVQEENHLFLERLAGPIEEAGFAWFRTGLGLYAAQFKFPGNPHWDRNSLRKAMNEQNMLNEDAIGVLGMDIISRDPLDINFRQAELGDLSVVYYLLESRGEGIVAKLMNGAQPGRPLAFKEHFEKVCRITMHQLDSDRLKFWMDNPR